MTFILASGERREVGAEAGMTLLEIAWANDIGIEGACEGEMACATCHVKQYKEWAVSQHAYAQLSPIYMAMQTTSTSRPRGPTATFASGVTTRSG